MSDFNSLKRNLKKDYSPFAIIKVALLADSASQFLVQSLRGMGYEYQLNLDIWESDFNQVERQVFDYSSDLYLFDPEVIIIFHSTHKLLGEYNKLPANDWNTLATNRLAHINNIYTSVNNHLKKAKIIYFNYSEINDAIFGNYANKMESSFLYQIRKLNVELMAFAALQPNFYIIDLSSVQNQFGKAFLFQPSIYINTEMVLSIEILPEVAEKTVQIIAAFYGTFKKCLIIDLDNTIWGGVIGDDGVENIEIGSLGIGKAFTELQYWIKKLKNRGVLIAVCSKNTESIAKEPFEKHPDMVLRLDDIALFVANWNNKADNIKYIQKVLNIGFDSMVFLDDNPFERNIVRQNIIGITVPELPDDPAEYLEFLYVLNLFETVSYTNEDILRTKQYKVEELRSNLQKNFVNEVEFLESLGMTSLVEPFNKFNIPRVAQLSQRSNQFNLRTVRYTEADIEMMSVAKDVFSFTFTLEDKFGENGIVCVIILKQITNLLLFIDTWFMSCRVLKRGMEHFVLNTICNFAKINGYTFLQGEYLPTAKNSMVKDLYPDLGFENINGNLLLNLTNYSGTKCLIKNK